MTRLIAAAALAALALAGCGSTTTAGGPVTTSTGAATSAAAPQTSSAAASSGAASSAAASSAAPGTVSCVFTTTSKPAKPVDPPKGDSVPATGKVTATITTNQGPVTVTMDRAKTPCTIASFLSLSQQKFYDGSQCHRLADKGLFMLQCGDPTGTGRGGPGYSFKDEVYPTDTFKAGTVAMANAGPNTNGSQFFFVYQDSQLPPKYTVFGQLDAASLGVIARIAAEGQDGSNPDGTGKPNNEARILSVAVG